jgi:DNA-binding NtrC family response regulator
MLEAHDWPGNVRELRNAVERALLLCSSDEIAPQHLIIEEPPEEDRGARASVSPAASSAPSTPPAPGTEKQRIEQALAACGGNQSRAARMLGMPRSTLLLRLEAYDITRPRKRAPGAQ